MDPVTVLLGLVAALANLLVAVVWGQVRKVEQKAEAATQALSEYKSEAAKELADYQAQTAAQFAAYQLTEAKEKATLKLVTAPEMTDGLDRLEYKIEENTKQLIAPLTSMLIEQKARIQTIVEWIGAQNGIPKVNLP